MKIPWHNTVPKEIQDFKQAEGIYTTFNKLSKGSKILWSTDWTIKFPTYHIGEWLLVFALQFLSLGSFSLRRRESRDLKYRSENSLLEPSDKLFDNFEWRSDYVLWCLMTLSSVWLGNKNECGHNQINVRTTWKSQLNLGNAANEFTNLTVKTPHLITHCFQFTFCTLLWFSI
jgi:hypothetical protein